MILELQKKEISDKNLDLLQEFIDNIGASSGTFRYFNNRNIDCIKNHLFTCIFTVSEVPIAYGHLDQENGKVWLGIAVKEGYTGLGVGQNMMKEIIKAASRKSVKKVYLSVDKTNHAAIKLYEKFRFTRERQDVDTLFMERTLKQ